MESSILRAARGGILNWSAEGDRGSNVRRRVARRWKNETETRTVRF